MGRRMKSDRLNYICLFWALIIFSFGSLHIDQVVSADEPSHKEDSLFENQIRSMTAPKPPLKSSGDPRFQNNRDGTVTDLEHGLMWKQQDSYQERKEWTNWEAAHLYVEEINKKKFASYGNWRLPTRKELLTLYEEDKSIPWFYYWTTNEVHMDPIFGYTSCCFWTSEEHEEIYAWHVNFLRGKAYPGIKKGKKNQAAGSASLSVVRPVRDAESISSLPKENQTEQDETHSEGLGFEAAEVDQEVEAGEGVTSSKARMDK